MQTYLVVIMVTMFALVVPMATGSSNYQRSAVLDRYLGTWRSQVDLKPSDLVPQGVKLTETQEVEWVLSDQFIQVKRVSGDREDHEMIQHDSQSNEYRRWIFNSNGEPSYWLGKWDPESEVMHWELQFGGPITGSIVDYFLSVDSYSTRVTLMSGEERVLIDAETEHTLLQ